MGHPDPKIESSGCVLWNLHQNDRDAVPENADFALDFGLIGAGDISELIKEELEKVENAE